VKTTIDRPDLRPVLVPLVKAARSGALDLADRARAIRFAYFVRDRELRSAVVRLLECVSPSPVSPARLASLVREALAAKGVERRVRVAALQRFAKYVPAFLKWVETQSFPNAELNQDLKFYSLPPEEQKKVYERWGTWRKQWAEKSKPEGLSDETVLTPECYDETQEGDLLWIAWRPDKLHKVVGRGKTKGGKSYLDLVLVDPKDTSKEGTRRSLFRSSVEGGDVEMHKMPKVEPEEIGLEIEETEPETEISFEDESEPEVASTDEPEPDPETAPDEPEPQGKRKPRKDSAKASVPDSIISLATPKSMGQAMAKRTREGLKKITVGDAKKLIKNIGEALADLGGETMKSLRAAGYTDQALRDLQSELQQHLEIV
jgi:hypothetical protein